MKSIPVMNEFSMLKMNAGPNGPTDAISVEPDQTSATAPCVIGKVEALCRFTTTTGQGAAVNTLRETLPRISRLKELRG